MEQVWEHLETGGVYRGAGMVRGGNPGADRRGVAAAACGPADPNAPPHPPVLSGTGRGVSALLPAAAAPHGGGGISGGPGGQPAPALSAGGADVLRHLQRRGLLEPLYPVLGADGEWPAPAAPPGRHMELRSGYPAALRQFFPPRSPWRRLLLDTAAQEICRQEAAGCAGTQRAGGAGSGAAFPR